MHFNQDKNILTFRSAFFINLKKWILKRLTSSFFSLVYLLVQGNIIFYALFKRKTKNKELEQVTFCFYKNHWNFLVFILILLHLIVWARWQRFRLYKVNWFVTCHSLQPLSAQSEIPLIVLFLLVDRSGAILVQFISSHRA